MDPTKKEKLAYITISIISIVHIYVATISNLISSGGRIDFTPGLVAIWVIGLVTASISFLLWWLLVKKDWSFLMKIGVIKPEEVLETKHLLRCYKCGEKVLKTATACPKCGVRFKYDKEEIGYMMVFIVGIVLVYWPILKDLVVGGTVVIGTGDGTIMTVGLVISVLGLILFSYKKAGFSTLGPMRTLVGKVEIVTPEFGFGGAKPAGYGGGGPAPSSTSSMPLYSSEELMKREEEIRKQLEMESRLNEMEIRRRLEREAEMEKERLKEKLDLEARKKERLKQMLSETKMEELEMKQMLEEERKKVVTGSAIPIPQQKVVDKDGMKIEITKSKSRRLLYPFSAIVGQEIMKKALILNAINPNIGGVLIRGQKGTAKSTAVRGLVEILPDIRVVKGCRFNCDPDEPSKFCWECEEKIKRGELETEGRPIRVVDLPLNSTEDRLVGSIDLEMVLSEGVKAFEPGIMAEAHRGILYVDEINLLDDYIVDVLLDSAAMGINTVERESVSVSHPSRFIIVGSMNPEEGELRPQLLDRIALQVEIAGLEDLEKRVQIIQLQKEFLEDSMVFRKKYEKEQNRIKEQIAKARGILQDTYTPKEILDIIGRICLDFNVDGHRADIIIERTARTNAALEGRAKTTVEDVVLAAELALPHRMRKRPFEEEVFSGDMLRQLVRKYSEGLEDV